MPDRFVRAELLQAVQRLVDRRCDFCWDDVGVQRCEQRPALDIPMLGQQPRQAGWHVLAEKAVKDGGWYLRRREPLRQDQEGDVAGIMPGLAGQERDVVVLVVLGQLGR